MSTWEGRLSARGWMRLLAIFGMLVMAGSLRNGWVQDDAPLIERNATVHEWSGLWSGFTGPYWPPPSDGGLYRPLARSTHTLLWKIGGGSPLPFRVVDLLLYGVLVGAVFTLGRTLVHPRAALFGALFFAVHPVHVEAVAVAVNQGELIAAIAAAWAVVIWSGRLQGNFPMQGRLDTVILLYLIALGFKEHALILPLLLVAYEVTVGRTQPDDRRARWRGLGLLGAVGAAWWTLRAFVLGGFSGAAAVQGLRGAGFTERCLTMLGVAGEWARLLLWPARLQGDYSPWEIAPYTGWAPEQTAGLMVLGAYALALVLAWRRRPAVAFALLWTGIALLPVSNIIIPTGILLAERTLMLASVGVVLALAASVPEGVWAWRGVRRTLVAACCGLPIGLGFGRSADRMQIYQDRDTYLAALRRDAPDSWRVMVGAGIAEMEKGDRAEGERLLAAAHAAWPASPRPIQLLAFYHRLGGRCDAAIPYLEESLRLDPADTWTRLPYVACLLDLGRYTDAKGAALIGAGEDENGAALRHAAVVADSALAAHAPAHTVRLPAIRGGLTLIGNAP